MTAKPIIGIVGGIGAGKSTVARVFGDRGGHVIDADRLGHAALAEPEVLRRLGDRWGARILNEDGTANRRAIAGIVFQNPAERAALEGVVFPYIKQRVSEEIRKAAGDPAVRYVVLDAAVMLEAGWNETCTRIVYVDAPRETRLSRLAARSGWSEEQVAAREAAQMPAAEKRTRSDAVIVNDGPPDRLLAQVDRLLAEWGF